jgi:nucleoside-diphosphate-sugar epimerase
MILGHLHAGVTELTLGSTRPTRDFPFVTDTVAGFRAVAQADRSVGELINIGSGQEIYLGELAQLFHRAVRQAGPPRSRTPSASCPWQRAATGGNSKAPELTDWTPRMSLRTGLQRTSDCIHDHLDAARAVHYRV